MFTVEDPGHFVDQDVVQRPGVVVLEDLDHVLDELHVHVLEAAAGAVEHQGHLVAVAFAVGKISRVELDLGVSRVIRSSASFRSTALLATEHLRLNLPSHLRCRSCEKIPDCAKRYRCS